MAYTFDPLFAADPNNPATVAANASITLFDPADVTQAPVTITDVTGAPLTNPVTVNKNGFGPAFQHATLDRLGWSGGGFTGYFTSFEGIKAAAVAAQNAAETAGNDAAAAASADLAAAVADAEAAQAAAATSATAAANSASLVNAPADTAVETLINGTGTATRTALNATYVPTQKDAADTFKGMTQRLNFGDTAAAKGSIINIDHRGDGTGNATSPGQAYGLDLHNYPGAETALVIHQYSSLKRAVQIDNTGTQPALEIHNTQNLTINPGSDGTGDFVLLRDHGTSILRVDKDLVFRLGGTKVPTFLHTAAKALSVQTSSAFNGEAMDVSKTGTGAGTALKVNNSGTGAGVQINQTGAGQALRIVANVAANAGVFAALIEGYDYGPSLTTVADGGTTFQITKNGTGNGTGLSIVNKGTGTSLAIRDTAAELFAITAGGLPKWTAAANQQTTVGAAGAASALPATPSKYLKVQDSAGATYVIPVYNAA